MNGLFWQAQGLAASFSLPPLLFPAFSAPGGVWEVANGLKLTRLVIGWSATDDEHDIAHAALVTVKIKPRTRLLLSTI